MLTTFELVSRPWIGTGSLSCQMTLVSFGTTGNTTYGRVKGTSTKPSQLALAKQKNTQSIRGAKQFF